MTSKTPFLRTAAAVLVLFGCTLIPAAARAAAPESAAAKKSFDVPAGEAASTFRQFIAQSQVQLLYAADEIAGVQTNSVRGSFTPHEALEQLLAGTRLRPVRTDNGSLAVKGVALPNADRAAPATAADRPTRRRTPSRSDFVVEEGTIELSPFVVNSDGDVGYLAANTLAGSRFNTPLRDTAATVSILTAEFLSDLGVQSLDDAMEWLPNMTLDVNARQASDNDYFVDPNAARSRGSKVTRTRNYFKWNMPTDAYNIERIEDSRGPNSVLFGIGSPAGVVNVSTKQANLSRNFVRAGFNFDDYSTRRGTLDYNQVLLDGRLGLRLNAVYAERSNPQRLHAMSKPYQATLAATFKLNDKTRIRAEYEGGENREVIARSGTAADGITAWLAKGSQLVSGSLTSAQQTAAGVNRFGVGERVTLIVDNAKSDDGGFLMNMKNQYQSAGEQIDFQNNDLVSPTVNTGGPGQLRVASFNAFSVFLERQFGRNTFVELAYNHQDQMSDAYHSYGGGGTTAAIRIDPNPTLPNGQPNPNVGRLYTEGVWNRFVIGSRADDTRIALSTQFDFGKWGKYQLGALAFHHWEVDVGQTPIEVWQGKPFHAVPYNAANVVWRRSYITEGDWSSYWLNSPALTPIVSIVDPVSGKTLTSTWVQQEANYRDDPAYYDTIMANLQARFFKDRLVFGTGVRKDWLKVHDLQVPTDPVTGEFYIDYEGKVLPPVDGKYDGITRTLGVVYHLTRHLSVFYNWSSNFSLPNTFIKMAPDAHIPPNGDNFGQDVGLALELLDGRVYVRGNYYDVRNKGGSNMLGGASRIDTLNARITGGLLAAGVMTQAEYDSRVMPLINGASSEGMRWGYELSVTGNLTKNWRLSANYSYTDGKTVVWGPEFIEWWDKMKPFYQSFDQTIASTAGIPISQEIANWEANSYEPFLRTTETPGLTGNRKHKVNLFTNYTFSRGWLKGLSIGGGYRHQSRQKIGSYSNLEIQYGNSFWTSNGSIGYRFAKPPAFLHVKRLHLQMNVDNLTNNRTPIVNRRVVDAPNLPGARERVWGVAIPAPRIMRFSMNAEF